MLACPGGQGEGEIVTDQKIFTEMLDRAGIVWIQTVVDYPPTGEDDPVVGNTLVNISQGGGKFNRGYCGFCTEFEFDQTGKLISVGLWE